MTPLAFLRFWLRWAAQISESESSYPAFRTNAEIDAELERKR